jgi:hypothetical protein
MLLFATSMVSSVAGDDAARTVKSCARAVPSFFFPAVGIKLAHVSLVGAKTRTNPNIPHNHLNRMPVHVNNNDSKSSEHERKEEMTQANDRARKTDTSASATKAKRGGRIHRRRSARIKKKKNRHIICENNNSVGIRKEGVVHIQKTLARACGSVRTITKRQRNTSRR